MASFLKGLGRTLGTVAGTTGAAIGGYQQDQEYAAKQAMIAAREQQDAENDRVRNALMGKQTAQVGLPEYHPIDPNSPEGVAAAIAKRPPEVRNIDPNSPEGVAAAIAKRPPQQESAAQAIRTMKEQDANDAAEGWFNSDKGPDANAAANDTFKALRAAHPDWKPQQIMRAVQSGTTASAQGANLTARTDKLQGGGATFGLGTDGKFGMIPPTGAPKAAPAKPATPAAVPTFARPAGWDDAKWNRYLTDTGQKP